MCMTFDSNYCYMTMQNYKDKLWLWDKIGRAAFAKRYVPSHGYKGLLFNLQVTGCTATLLFACLTNVLQESGHGAINFACTYGGVKQCLHIPWFTI